MRRGTQQHVAHHLIFVCVLPSPPASRFACVFCCPACAPRHPPGLNPYLPASGTGFCSGSIVESAPFKLTAEFVDLMDGPNSACFKGFREVRERRCVCRPALGDRRLLRRIIYFYMIREWRTCVALSA